MRSFFNTKGGRLVLNLLAALVSGLLLTGASLLLDGPGLRPALALALGSPLRVVFTALFFTLVILMAGLLLGRLHRGMALVNAAAVVILLIDYFKQQITSIPLELADFKLVGQVGDIAELNAQSLVFSRSVIAAAAVPLLWVAFLWFAERKWGMLAMERSWNLCSAGGSLLVFLALFVGLADPLIYIPLGTPLTTGFSQSYVTVRTGTTLGLWRATQFQDTMVGSYSASVMDKIRLRAEPYLETSDPGQPGSVKPNVILILSESFSDVTDLPGVHYESDPLAEFHALQQQSVTGSFHTRSLGYGTCNIELEVLTGVNNRLLSYGTDVSGLTPEELGALPSVPALLKEEGYYTAFLHLFDDSIYHRTELFSRLGFDEMFFSGDMARVDPEAAAAPHYWTYLEDKISGDFYGDQYMTELLIHLYEQHDEEGPVFLYGVTMENHAPFTAEKYDQYDYPFTVDAQLTQDAWDMLQSYTQGVSQSSKALQSLVDYFAQVEEPTVIVFYGDHRPGSSLYTELGMYSDNIASADAATIARLYATEYLIWANDPALLQHPVGERVDTSSNYLGLDILRTAGVTLPRYWQMVDVLRQHSLIYTWSYFLDQEGRPSYTITDRTDQEPFTVMSYLLHDSHREQYLTPWLWEREEK